MGSLLLPLPCAALSSCAPLEGLFFAYFSPLLPAAERPIFKRRAAGPKTAEWVRRPGAITSAPELLCLWRRPLWCRLVRRLPDSSGRTANLPWCLAVFVNDTLSRSVWRCPIGPWPGGSAGAVYCLDDEASPRSAAGRSIGYPAWPGAGATARGVDSGGTLTRGGEPLLAALGRWQKVSGHADPRHNSPRGDGPRG